MSDSASYTPPPPPPGGGSSPPPAGANSDRAIFLVLSYLGILSLIPLLAKKDDPEVQWHAKNGVVLFGAEIVWFIVQIIIGFVPVLGCGVHIIGCLAWLGILGLTIFCIVKALQGQRLRLPVITDIAEKL